MRNTCTVEKCAEFVVGGGLCRKHYMRLQRKGSTSDVRKNARTHEECSVDGCERPYVANGLCNTHYVAAKPKPVTVLMRPVLVCAHCGIEFRPERYKSGSMANKFCSRQCKSEARNGSPAAQLSARKSYFKTKYGLTLEQIEEMAALGCAICGTTDWPGHHNRPHVDHDHDTGEVRGILCSECNTGLGKFKDDPVLLARAVDYLSRSVI